MDSETRRIEKKTSRTAEWTCVSRAASSLESDSHYRCDDHIALLLVPTFLKLILHISLFRQFFSRVLTPKGIYEYTIARTRYIDQVCKEVLAEGFEQVLILGAGFDTRALRFHREARDARFFELDLPTTQKAKLKQYVKRGISIPDNVVFISVDFDRESLTDKLDQAGFRRGGRSLFLLEGLLMYLQPVSVDENFKVVSAFAGQDSVVVFDYVRTSVLEQAGLCHGEKGIIKSVSRAGEKWHFGIEEEELKNFLMRYGLRVFEHRDAQDLERMYFTDTSGEILGRVNGTHCLVRAVKT
jgi:methyltransferase (TIGR00027 family)